MNSKIFTMSSKEKSNIVIAMLEKQKKYLFIALILFSPTVYFKTIKQRLFNKESKHDLASICQSFMIGHDQFNKEKVSKCSINGPISEKIFSFFTPKTKKYFIDNLYIISCT